MKLTRLFTEPIISSRVYARRTVMNPYIDFENFHHWWELRSTFNPGVILKDKMFYLLYRAQDFHFISRFGLAIFDPEKKCISYRPELPVFELLSPLDIAQGRIGCEDPRITYLEDEKKYVITYVSASIKPINAENTEKLKKSRPYGWYEVSSKILTTVDFNSFVEHGSIFGGEELKDVVLFPKKHKNLYTFFLRFVPSIQIAFSESLNKINNYQTILSPRPGMWDSEKIGAGSPPVLTERGWLCIYHGIDRKHIYRLGYFILDKNDPTRVLYRSEKPILEPKLSWEKKGNTPNVVFTNGVGVFKDELYVFYGAADTVIGVAKAKLSDFLNF